MVWSMQTRPATGYERPPMSTRPRLENRRLNPSAYPTGIVAIQVSAGAVQVRP